MKNLIDHKDYHGIEQALFANLALANVGLPYDSVNTTKAHPLHRICDGVYAGKFTDEEGVQIAKIFLRHGANINGNELIEKQDTPLIAAASLHADLLAMLYMQHGADIHHAGCHGGTALHWAAWCGRKILVQKLLEAGAEINKLCIDFKSTPLFWAAHGLKNGGTTSTADSIACMGLLMRFGADSRIPNFEGITVMDLLADFDEGVKAVLKTS
jgi:uncharacterized protein